MIIDHLKELLPWAVAVSVVMFVGSLVVIPLLAARIRPDYFLHPQSPVESWQRRHPAVRILLLILKNLLGVILVLVGIVMIPAPGQGIITILIGIMMLNFPGKQTLELWVIRLRGVLAAVNWMRSKMGKPPLKIPERPPRINDH